MISTYDLMIYKKIASFRNLKPLNEVYFNIKTIKSFNG